MTDPWDVGKMYLHECLIFYGAPVEMANAIKVRWIEYEPYMPVPRGVTLGSLHRVYTAWGAFENCGIPAMSRQQAYKMEP